MSNKVQCKWANPHEWLEERMDNANWQDLYQMAVDMAGRLDGDSIQDLFQGKMDEDGYFEPIKDEKEAVGNVFWQVCHDCNEEFKLKYNEDGTYDYMGGACDCPGSFSPRHDSPSMHEWLLSKGIVPK